MTPSTCAWKLVTRCWKSNVCMARQALCRVSRLPQALQQQLLHPQPQGQAGRNPALAACGLPDRLLRELERRHNASQQAAIAAALSGQDVFTLIQVCFGPKYTCQAHVPSTQQTVAMHELVSEAQDAVFSLDFGQASSHAEGLSCPYQGPPGTGKTSAIVTLVSALCAKRRAAVAAADAGGLATGEAAGSAVRVLVCAQSNAAVDELVTRLAAHSTPDGQQTRCGLHAFLGLRHAATCSQQCSVLSQAYVLDAHEAHRQLQMKQVTAVLAMPVLHAHDPMTYRRLAADTHMCGDAQAPQGGATGRAAGHAPQSAAVPHRHGGRKCCRWRCC